MTGHPEHSASRIWRASLLASAGGLVPLILLGILTIALSTEPEYLVAPRPNLFAVAGSFTLLNAALLAVVTLCTASLAFTLRDLGRLNLRSLILTAALACIAPSIAVGFLVPLQIVSLLAPLCFVFCATSGSCWLFVWRITLFKAAPTPQTG